MSLQIHDSPFYHSQQLCSFFLYPHRYRRDDPKGRKPTAVVLPPDPPRLLLSQDGDPGIPGAAGSRGGLWDVESAGAQSPERGGDP